jgi:superfamily II DNA/RNA helicase
VAGLLAGGEAVVVFTAFVATARALRERLADRFPCVLLPGGVPADHRQALVEEFQGGGRSLLIATYGTGGLGFTLHRARHVVLIERPWTPGDTEQAEDRCHRIGMGAGLSSHWVQLGQADGLVDGIIESKAQRIALLLESRRELGRRRTLPERVRRMLESW